MGYPYCIHFDTSVVSRNFGDQIIRQSIIDVLDQIVPNLRILTSYTHETPGWKTARLAQRSELNIIGGTNCLTGQRLRYSMWKIGIPSLLLGVRYILLGVGWYRHNNKPNLISSAIYRCALSRQYIHSCRDDYTTKVVRSMGLQAINTGCPTMWGLTTNHLVHLLMNGKTNSSTCRNKLGRRAIVIIQRQFLDRHNTPLSVHSWQLNQVRAFHVAFSYSHLTCV